MRRKGVSFGCEIMEGLEKLLTLLPNRLAWAELRITMAKLLWYFDFELASPDEDWWNKQRTYLIWERLPLMVNLKPRTA